MSRKLEESSTQTLGSLEGFVAELIEARGSEGVASTWVYPHEEFSWMPLALLKKEVELLFDGSKLVSWETRRRPPVATTGTYGYQDPFPAMTFPTKDDVHHEKGHKHHHGHK